MLTHFHSDHTVGLTRGFDSGTIYCTVPGLGGGLGEDILEAGAFFIGTTSKEVTAALIINMMGVDPAHVRALPLEQTVEASWDKICSATGEEDNHEYVIFQLFSWAYPFRCCGQYQLQGQAGQIRYHQRAIESLMVSGHCSYVCYYIISDDASRNHLPYKSPLYYCSVPR